MHLLCIDKAQRVLPRWQAVHLKVQLLPIVLDIVWCTQQKKKSAFQKWQTLIWWAGFTQYPLWHAAQFYISLSGNQTTTMRLPRNYVLNSPKFGTFLAFNLWNLFQELCFRHLQVTNISLSTPEHFHYTRLLRYKGATALTAIILLKVDK